MARIAVIGSGAMGSAFARGMISAGVYRPEEVLLADTDAARLKKTAGETGAVAADSNAAAAAGADIVLVVVKPAFVKDVAADIASSVAGKLVIYIAAGVKLATVESGLPDGTPVISAMPNTPCRIGAGAIGFCRGRHATDEHVAAARRIFDAVGLSVEVPEKLMNAVTGLSGSGPAYVFIFIEALADAGVRMGLPRDIALKLGAQTVLGAARMVIEEDEHPARLKDQVTSPGGTTITALDVLERAGFRSAVIEAVKAATNRAEELG